jgi:hypothetical protein
MSGSLLKVSSRFRSVFSPDPIEASKNALSADDEAGL